MDNWQRGLCRPRLTREEFQNLCAEAIRELFPEVVIEQPEGGLGRLVVTLAGETHSVFLDNLWSQCKDRADTRAEEVERFLKALVAHRNIDELPRVEYIVPTIKDQVYLDFARQQTNKEPSFAHEHFVGDLWIVYAVDSPSAISSLQKSHLERLGIDPTQLKKLAVENLKRILPPIEQHGAGPCYMLTAGGDYVASLILFDDLWKDLASIVEGDVVAGIPSRDVLLFTGKKSADGLNAMRKSIDRITAAGGYLVSTTMLRRHSDGWRVFS